MLKQRAESQEETRLRIVEATMRLHEEVGPRDTTISAIAEKAGVQRLTVYRHFPHETELFKACTSHWLALNPPPDPASWINEAGFTRTTAALFLLYRYYRGTQRMWAASYRDEAETPGMRGPMRQFRKYLTSIAQDLAGHLGPELAGADVKHATLAHAVEFYTWQSLARQGFDDAAMSKLVCIWLQGTAASINPSSGQKQRRSRQAKES
jgi:AcrR family transcriptional regulator